jgi:hypothetical protein
MNWKSIRWAKHLIISNSAFAILPALLNENVKEVVAPVTTVTPVTTSTPVETVKESVVEETSEDLDPYGAAGKKPSAVERTVVKTKVTPSSKSTSFASKDEEGNKLPTDVKKPHIAIPKNAAGMQQYRSDAVSPVERLFKSMMESKSQRSKAAGLNSGGKVKSASARADGCAIRGKTRA